MHFPKFYYPTYCCSSYGSHCNEMWNRHTSDKADALKKQRQQIKIAQEIQNSEFYVLSNAPFNKQRGFSVLINRKGPEKRKKTTKKGNLQEGNFNNELDEATQQLFYEVFTLCS